MSAQHGGTERREARRAASRILSARAWLCAAGALACALIVVLVLKVPAGYPSWVLLLPSLAVIAIAGWTTRTLFPQRRPTDEVGLATTMVDEPELHGWMVALAKRLGVTAPDTIRLAPSTGARVDDLTGSPALVLGTGWLTWLHIDELNRLSALELSMLRVRDDPKITRALRLAGALDVDRLRDNSMPVVGRAIRGIGARFAAHREALYDACLMWAASAIPDDLRPTEAEVGEGRLADEGWQVLADRWMAPVAELGRGLDSLALPHRELLVACQESNLLERSWTRRSGTPAMALLTNAASTDAEVSRWLSEHASDEDLPPIGWDEFVDQITIPAWRTSLASAVDAANRIRGSAQPMSLATLLSAIESGSALGIGALLSHDEIAPDGSVDSNAARSKYDEALGVALSHAICLALVETGLATPVVDVLWGVVLEGLDGEQVSVDTNVKSFCRNEDWDGLRRYVESLDLDPDQRLRLGATYGDMGLDEAPDVVAIRRWKVNDIIFADGCLRAYPRSIWRQLSDLFWRMAGVADGDGDRYDEVTGDERRVIPGVSIALSDVSSAELFRRPNGLAWTMRLTTPQTTLNFTGVGDGGHVAPILQGVLRGRLAVTGLGVRPSRFVRLLGKIGWYVICGGVLVLLSGALGFALGTGEADGSRQTVSTVEAVATFGVLGGALIAIGLIPYMFVARRGHRPA